MPSSQGGRPMKNREGVEYSFQKINNDEFKIVGDLKHWRYGGKDGQAEIDTNDLGFVDPSGGPFISVGSLLNGRKVTNIRIDADSSFIFELQPYAA